MDHQQGAEEFYYGEKSELMEFVKVSKGDWNNKFSLANHAQASSCRLFLASSFAAESQDPPILCWLQH
jgi:hypothetical protein